MLALSIDNLLESNQTHLIIDQKLNRRQNHYRENKGKVSYSKAIIAILAHLNNQDLARDS